MDLIAEQCRRNVAADDTWMMYSAHRERVTRALLEARTASAERLCLLGAGNLNDFDLAALLTAFREIVLVDLDPGALQRGLTRQGLAGETRIRIVAPVDVSGVFAELTALENADSRDVTIEHCLRTLAQTPDLDWKGS